jgi:hypothetical protein
MLYEAAVTTRFKVLLEMATVASGPPTRRGVAFLVASAVPMAAVLGGLGNASPPILSLMGIAALAVLFTLARSRILEGPPPVTPDVIAAVVLGLSFTAAIVVGGYGIALTERMQLTRVAQAWAIIALVMGTFLYRHDMPAFLVGAEGAVGAAADRSVPPHALRVAIVGLGLLLHGAVFASLPPVIQIDSWVNQAEPPFFEYQSTLFHHPPVYVFLTKATDRVPSLLSFLGGLRALVILQHVLVIAMALAVERIVRLETRRPVLACLAGIFLALEPHLAFYAQYVMTEVVSIAFGTAAVMLLVEASHRPRADAWVIAAGASAAFATCTRQVYELWLVVVVAWLVAANLIRPRRRAVLLFLVAAIVPVGAVVLHNHVFIGRAALTAETGRQLVYRLVDGMPDLTDPDAPPGDEHERARQLIWENRHDLWVGAYQAIERELDWSDAQVDVAVQRFFIEQVRRHPATYARVTASYAVDLLLTREDVASILSFHNLVRRQGPEAWHVVPEVPTAPPFLEQLMATKPTSRVAVLALVALAPLLARGRSRWLALLALGSILYFVAVIALIACPAARFRLPFVPFIILGLASALAGVMDLPRRWRRSGHEGLGP